MGYDEISISNIPAKQNILKSNVKVVSGGSVIALDSFGSSSFKSTTEAFRKGAKGNLAGKFKSSGHNAFRYANKTQKNAVMKCTAANGWKITGVSFNNNRTHTQYSTNYNAPNSGASSSTLRIGNRSAKQSAYISFTLRNTKNGAVQYCTLNMN